MDIRLQHLSEQVELAITEVQKQVREAQKSRLKRDDNVNLVKKLKTEIAAEQKELAAERKKSKSLSTKRCRLIREIEAWQQKLDQLVAQSKQLKSRYVGQIGMDVDDATLDADDGDESTSLAPIRNPELLIPELPSDLPETECKMWSVESAVSDEIREPKTLALIVSRNGYRHSPKGRRGQGSPGKKRKRLSAESDSDDRPKKRPARKRVVDADGVSVSKPASEFKKECLALLNSTESEPLCEKTDESSLSNGADLETDLSSTEELAMVVGTRIPGKPVDVICASHKFKPGNIVVIPRRISRKDFESKLKLILECHNLRVLCMFGVRQLQNLDTFACEFLAKRLADCCPNIQHFILDESVLDVAIAYQEAPGNTIRVVEVKNTPSSVDEVIHLITEGKEIRSVYLDHSTDSVIEAIVPQLTSISLSWLTDTEFKSFVMCSATSQITELKLETVDLKMDAARISQLAGALPLLQRIKLSAPLENIHCLKSFGKLQHVVFDAEPLRKRQTLDPNFPIDMTGALKMTEEKDTFVDVVVKEEEDPDRSQESLTCEIALNDFFSSCGSSLISFSITIHDRFKKDMFHSLRKSCLLLRDLTIFSDVEQYFETKSLSLPSLERLSLHQINFTDVKLVELLDSCQNLDYLSIDKPRKVTSACLKVLQFYGEEVFLKKAQRPAVEKFTAIIVSEGKDEITKQIRAPQLDITFKQKAIIEVTNRLRYKY